LQPSNPNENFGFHRPASISLILSILAIFFVVNFVTCDRSPTVWRDEVFFSDPAFHLSSGQGFTSTVSPAEQPYGTFWVMNSPLHPLLLAGWMHVWGFSVLSVRTFDLVVVTLAYGVMALAAWRWGRNMRRELLLFLLLGCCGVGVTFAYRAARPECLGMLWGALCWLTLSVSQARARLVLLTVLGFFVPFIGLHLILALGLYGLALLAAVKGHPRQRWELAWLGVGIGLGLCALVAIYAHFHVIHEWLHCLNKHSSPHKGIAKMVTTLGSAYAQDMSLVAVAVAGGIGLWALRFRVDPRIRNVYLAALLLPSMLTLAGNYPPYYSWLTFLPMSGAVAIVLCAAWPQFSGLNRSIVVALVGFAVVVGLPMRTALVFAEWDQRSYRPVDALLKSDLRKTDVVFSDYQGFYGSKYAARFYFPDSTTRGDWTGSVTVVVIGSECNFDEMQKKFGGAWIKMGEMSKAQPLAMRNFLPKDAAALYQLAVWRKSPAAR
jgi:hypothetical protein